MKYFPEGKLKNLKHERYITIKIQFSCCISQHWHLSHSTDQWNFRLFVRSFVRSNALSDGMPWVSEIKPNI